MATFVDLLWQVMNKLPIRSGGTGNDLGAARNMVLLSYMNDTGGAIALGTLVKLVGTGGTDLRVGPTTTANDLSVLGVVVGRFTTGDGLGLFEAVAPAHQDTVAVCITGRCTVLIESAVTQGQYAYVSSTSGKAAGVTAIPLGVIGRFESSGTTSAKVVLGSRATVTAPEDIYEDGVSLVDDYRILDFGNYLDARASGTLAAVEVDPTYLELVAEQVAVEDTSAYFTDPSPASGTETLRPTSDVAKSGNINYSSGTTGWNLVDESTLDTADWYSGTNVGSSPWYIVHGMAASALDATKRITSVTLKADTTALLGTTPGYHKMRDPQTGAVYTVGAGYAPGGTQPETVTVTTRPWDGRPWSVEDIRHLQAGEGQDDGGGNSLKVHQFWVEVDWTAPKTVESVLAELGSASPTAEILDHTTSETDADLVLAPDGAGGVEFRAESGGGGGSGTAFIGASVHATADQPITTGATGEAIAFDAENYDSDGFHDNATNNSRMTIPAGLGGKYHVEWNLEREALTSGKRWQTYVKKNGAATPLLYNLVVGIGGSLDINSGQGGDLDLAAGDYIEVWAAHDHGSDRNVWKRTGVDSFSLHKIGSGGAGSGIGARAYHGAFQAVTDNTATALLLNASESDTDSFHFESDANLTGTVAKTATSAAVVGTGTAFTTELSVNQVISIPGTAVEIGVVKSITDNTHLTLWQNMANTASGQTATRRSEYFAIPAGLGGKFHIEASTWAGGVSAGLALMTLHKNGAVVNGAYARASFATSTGPALGVAADLDLAAGDYIAAVVYHTKGSNADFGYNTPPNGACTAVSIARVDSGTSARWGSGTTFPSGPSLNDRWTRTDRNLDYFYDGTRWLSVSLYHLDVGQWQGISATNGYDSGLASIQADHDIYLVDFYASMFSSSLSGSAYWTINARPYDAGSAGTIFATVTNQSGTNSVYLRKKATINALLAASSDGLYIEAVKTSTPGVLSAGAVLTYRLVG